MAAGIIVLLALCRSHINNVILLRDLGLDNIEFHYTVGMCILINFEILDCFEPGTM